MFTFLKHNFKIWRTYINAVACVFIDAELIGEIFVKDLHVGREDEKRGDGRHEHAIGLSVPGQRLHFRPRLVSNKRMQRVQIATFSGINKTGK